MVVRRATPDPERRQKMLNQTDYQANLKTSPIPDPQRQQPAPR